jgi:hypothetical protein
MNNSELKVANDNTEEWTRIAASRSGRFQRARTSTAAFGREQRACYLSNIAIFSPRFALRIFSISDFPEALALQTPSGTL